GGERQAGRAPGGTGARGEQRSVLAGWPPRRDRFGDIASAVGRRGRHAAGRVLRARIFGRRHLVRVRWRPHPHRLVGQDSAALGCVPGHTKFRRSRQARGAALPDPRAAPQLPTRSRAAELVPEQVALCSMNLNPARSLQLKYPNYFSVSSISDARFCVKKRFSRTRIPQSSERAVRAETPFRWRESRRRMRLLVKARPLARMGYLDYTSVTDVFEMRPGFRAPEFRHDRSIDDRGVKHETDDIRAAIAIPGGNRAGGH